MNKELCTILRRRLEDLPFVGLLAGIVQPLTLVSASDTVPGVRKIYPVSYDTNVVIPTESNKSPEIPLVPDSTKKSIIYFEDFGLSPTNMRDEYQSRVRCVVWLNRKLLVGEKYMDITGRCMGEIMKRINVVNPVSDGLFVNLQTRVTNIPPQLPELFGRYTYDEATRQYLRPPYEFFGLDITSTFTVNPDCLTGINWQIEGC